MAADSTSKHLWLELKPDYIDANFDQVLSYLKSFRADKDSTDTFYQTTLNLMRRRAAELIHEQATRAISEEEKTEPKDEVDRCKLLCLYLLSACDKAVPEYKAAFFTLVLHLLRCSKDSSTTEQLMHLALEVLSCESVTATGFNWDIFDLFSTDVLALKLMNGHKLVDDPERFVYLEKRGVLRANVGKVILVACNKDTLKSKESSLTASLDFFNGLLQVLDIKSNRLKQSDNADLEKIDEFVADFVGRQQNVKPVVRTLKQYSQNDTVDVELVSKKGETLRVRTVDPQYEPLEGEFWIAAPDKLLYYGIDDFRLYLKEGDQFSARIQSISASGTSKFAVDDEFKNYVVDEVYKGRHFCKEVLAKLQDIKTNRNGMQQAVWWTEYGFPAYTDCEEGMTIGMFAYIELSDTGTDKYRHFINAYYTRPAEEGKTFDIDLTRKDVITGFPYAEPLETEAVAEDVVLSADLAGEFARMLYFYQKKVRSASDRYKMLGVCRILCSLIGDEDASVYIRFVADYLENVVAFADEEYDSIKELECPESLDGEPGVAIRKDIVSILRQYGKDDGDELLNGMIEDSGNALLEKLAKLVQSSNRIRNVVSGNLLVHIRKEIISALSMDAGEKTDLEEKKGNYYGIEDISKEFKPSFFEAPDNSSHKQNWNIFKEICAFLNSQLGGTLYMGVSDSGYVQGVERDLTMMERIGLKGYAGMDGYKRFILDDAKKFFANQAVLQNLTMTPLEDGSVLAIQVQPWDDGIVEMDGRAFIRMDSESVEMDEQAKDQVVRRKLLSKKDEAQNVRNLMQAIKERKKVILHGYSSSTRTEDRPDMEPFAFEDNYQTVWCYEPASGKNKTYKVARIGSTEVLSKGWEYTAKHRQGKTDIFRMTGDTGIRVKMQLDNYAKMLLCEEFPKAVKELTPDADGTLWYLDTEVRSLYGIGRFYMGLGKEHITIIDTPAFEQFVAEYKEKNL